MNHCVLLDAIKNKATVVSVEDDEDVMKTSYRLIDCDTVQLLPVYPGRLQKGFIALVDEDTYGKDAFFNPMASWLYGSDDHGLPVFRNAVILKEIPDDFDFMSKVEAQTIADDLNAKANWIVKMTMSGVLSNL